MNIYLFSHFCLDEEEFPDLILYEHFINHYLNLGIKSKHFHIIPCGTGTHHANAASFKKINKQYKIKNIRLVKKQHDLKKCFEAYNKWRATINRQHWIVKVDLDEFNTYGEFESVYDWANWLQDNNYTAVRGEMMDCISQDNILNPVQPLENIFLQFPKQAKITLHLLNQNHYKVLLTKPYIELIWGHHNTLHETQDVHPKTFESDFLTFHFKWTDKLLKRCKQNLRTEDHELYSGFQNQIIKTKKIIKNNKLDVIIY